MLLSTPIQSVIPSAHGAVLGVLARTEESLSGRAVARLTNPAFSQKRVSVVLAELVAAGIALVERQPPSNLYRLNRDHVAAEGILALTRMWIELTARMTSDLESWTVLPDHAWMFGSAARGDGDASSDVDVLLIVPDSARSGEPDETRWHQQVEDFVRKVQLWSGNRCEVLELTAEELATSAQRGDRLVEDLEEDAVPLVGGRFNARRTAGRTAAT